VERLGWEEGRVWWMGNVCVLKVGLERREEVGKRVGE